MPVATLEVPIEKGVDGVFRVGGTHARLDVLVAAFNNGATAEEIALRYPSLKLADVYSAISFVLNNPAQVEDYLQQRQLQATTVREQNELRFNSAGIRSRLLARSAGN